MKIPLFHDRENEGWRPLQLVVFLFVVSVLAVCSGCSTFDPEPPVAQQPSADWLVEQTGANWIFSDVDYFDQETFFADPPTHPVLQQLQSSCEEYGYDFDDLRYRAWGWIQAVNHEGE